MTNKIKNNIGKKDQAWRSLLGFYAPIFIVLCIGAIKYRSLPLKDDILFFIAMSLAFFVIMFLAWLPVFTLSFIYKPVKNITNSFLVSFVFVLIFAWFFGYLHDQIFLSYGAEYTPTGRIVFPDGSGYHAFEPAYDYEGQLFALACFYYTLLIFVFSAVIELLKIIFVKVKKFLAQK